VLVRVSRAGEGDLVPTLPRAPTQAPIRWDGAHLVLHILHAVLAVESGSRTRERVSVLARVRAWVRAMRQPTRHQSPSRRPRRHRTSLEAENWW
jgi:hypothetical protein